MRSFGWFLVSASLHFLLSVAGTVVSLGAAFEAQTSFWAAPSEAGLAWLSAVLLAPLPPVRHVLPAAWQGGYWEIAVLSVLMGAAVVALRQLNRNGVRRRPV